MTDRQTPERTESEKPLTMHEQQQIEDTLTNLGGCWSVNDYKGAQRVMERFLREIQSEALASRAVPSTGEATDLMLGDLEYWRKFLLRARSRAGETPEAPVHIDHLTAAALCIGNVLKWLKSAAPSDPPAPAASSGAAPQEWQPIETLDPECLDVILRPHRVWGAMDVCRMTEAQKGQLTGVLSRGIDWRWMNGDHTTAWTEDAFLPFWMPRPPVPAAPPERPTLAETQE